MLIKERSLLVGRSTLEGIYSEIWFIEPQNFAIGFSLYRMPCPKRPYKRYKNLNVAPRAVRT